MDLSEITNSLMSSSKEYPIVAFMLGVFLLFLLFRRPQLFLLLSLLGLILAATLYLISDIASTGKVTKARMIEKSTTEQDQPH